MGSRNSRLLASSAWVAALSAAILVSGAQATADTRVVVRAVFNKELGAAILVDGRGRTLYMTTSDIGGVSSCAAISPDCPKVWPAVTSTAAPLGGKGVRTALLSVTPDGTHQVRYNRHPLYYFRGGHGLGRGDAKPGDVRGQGSFQIWYVVSPKGLAVRKTG
jgi:predicted lipoprotein with Yx(FWY)xxD motif